MQALGLIQMSAFWEDFLTLIGFGSGPLWSSMFNCLDKLQHMGPVTKKNTEKSMEQTSLNFCPSLFTCPSVLSLHFFSLALPTELPIGEPLPQTALGLSSAQPHMH